MSVFKNLKSLFIVEEGDTAPTPSAPATPPKSPSTKKVVAARPQRATSPEQEANTEGSSAHSPKGNMPDPKFVEVLLTAMEANNLEGFDYLEFKLSVQSLEHLPMDDATRFQSAYAMAKTLGATPEKIEASAEHYMKVLAKEEKKFENALDVQVQEKVGAGNEAVKGMEAAVQQKNQQIAALQAQIQQLEADIAAKKDEVAAAQAKINDTKAQFVAAYTYLNDQIADDLEKVKRFLPGNTPQ